MTSLLFCAINFSITLNGFFLKKKKKKESMIRQFGTCCHGKIISVRDVTVTLLVYVTAHITPLCLTVTDYVPIIAQRKDNQ